MQIYGKNYKIKVRKKYMSLTVRLQDRHRPTSKKLHTKTLYKILYKVIGYTRPTNRCNCE